MCSVFVGLSCSSHVCIVQFRANQTKSCVNNPEIFIWHREGGASGHSTHVKLGKARQSNYICIGHFYKHFVSKGFTVHSCPETLTSTEEKLPEKQERAHGERQRSTWNNVEMKFSFWWAGKQLLGVLVKTGSRAGRAGQLRTRHLLQYLYFLLRHKALGFIY